MSYFEDRLHTPGVVYTVYGGSMYDAGYFDDLSVALARAVHLSKIHKGHKFSVYATHTALLADAVDAP